MKTTDKPMSQREVIDALSVLAEVIKANKGMLLGDEDVIESANKKIAELIPKINASEKAN